MKHMLYFFSVSNLINKSSYIIICNVKMGLFKFSTNIFIHEYIQLMLEMSVPMIHSPDMSDWIFWNTGQRCYACNTQESVVFRVPSFPYDSCPQD